MFVIDGGSDRELLRGIAMQNNHWRDLFNDSSATSRYESFGKGSDLSDGFEMAA